MIWWEIYKIKIIHIDFSIVLSARYMPFIVIQEFILPSVPENGFY